MTYARASFTSEDTFIRRDDNALTCLPKHLPRRTWDMCNRRLTNFKYLANGAFTNRVRDGVGQGIKFGKCVSRQVFPRD